MRRRLTMVIAGGLMATSIMTGVALAAPPDPVTRSGLTDPDMAEAERLIDQRRFDVALPLLEEAAKRMPESADVFSMLGFALRKLGRLDESHARYQTALRIDPDHKGAREYLGELFLMRGEPDKAREQLTALERLCPTGCEERAELEAAIKAAAR